MTKVNELDWRPLSEAPHNTFVLLRGPSEYKGIPYRYLSGVYRPGSSSYAKKYNWRDYAGNAVTDGGPMVTEFAAI